MNNNPNYPPNGNNIENKLFIYLLRFYEKKKLIIFPPGKSFGLLFLLFSPGEKIKIFHLFLNIFIN